MLQIDYSPHVITFLPVVTENGIVPDSFLQIYDPDTQEYQSLTCEQEDKISLSVIEQLIDDLYQKISEGFCRGAIEERSNAIAEALGVLECREVIRKFFGKETAI